MADISWKRNRLRHVTTVAFCGIMLGGGLSTRIAASEWDQKTIVTFNTPVEVPGKDLPPGTYVFKRLDSPTDRAIVQIFDKDEKRLYATILAIPDYRLKPTGKPVIRFEERPSDSPPALKAWFYPGEEDGLQFVYTHDRATDLAKRTKQNVLSMRNEMEGTMTAPASSPDAPNVKALEITVVTAVTPSGEQVGMDQAASTTAKNPKK